MVGDKDADVLVFQSPDDVLNLLNGNRIHAGKRLVQHHKLGFYGQTAGYLRTAPFATRQTVALVLPDVHQVELLNQLFQFLLLVFARELGQFQYGTDIILHRHLAEHARFLRQVADA